MIQISDKSKCCGCTACASVCAHEAIIMQPDVMGFSYPVVDAEKCVECGLCERVCSFHENYDTTLNFNQPMAYAARHRSMEEIMKSRSGAAFVAISDYILDQGGVVYGAGYKDHFRVTHKRATTKEERDEFRGSKYVQSDLAGIFKQVKDDLKKDLMVLFSGTPCQTAGLNAYVGKKLRENLILVDIVCHGVPSPYLFRDYIAYLEKKRGDVITVVNFRDKEQFGWRAHHETFKFKHGGGKFIYSYLFYQHVMFRHSCGVCPYTNIRRPSDITIADFWGWEKTDPEFNKDDKGVSLILVNTEKGKLIFDAIKKDLTLREAKIENCLQPCLVHPSVININRDKFEHDYAKHGFEYVMNHYGNVGWRYKIKTLKGKVIGKLMSVIYKILLLK